MIFTKASIQGVDLDDLERQLRDFVEVERRFTGNSEERKDRRCDADARQFVVRATARLDGIARAAAAPHTAFALRASSERSVVSRCARALAAPLLLLAVGTGTAVVMLGPVGEGPATNANNALADAQAAKIGGYLQTPSQSALLPAVSTGNPNQSVVLNEQSADGVAAPAAAPPREVETTQAPALPSTVIAFGPVSVTPAPAIKPDDAAEVLPARADDDQIRSQLALDPPALSSPTSNQTVVVAEQSPDGIAALATTPPGETETAQVPASPSTVIAFGPVSVRAVPVIEADDAAEVLPARVAGDEPVVVAEHPPDGFAAPATAPSGQPQSEQATALQGMAVVPRSVTADLPASARPSVVSSPSLPDELADSSVGPKARSTDEAISEGPAPVAADLATPQTSAPPPPVTPSLAPVAMASPELEAVASAASLPDELADPSAGPRARSTEEAISEGPAPVVADVATPQASAPPPPVTPSPPQTFGQATPGTPIERAKPPAAQLVIGQASSPGAGEALLLNVSLSNAPAGAMIVIKGLAAGSTLTVGRASGAGRWRLTPAELRDALLRPPQGFVGAMELGLELRLANDSIADLKTLHLEWGAPAVAQTTRPGLVVRHLDSDEVAALVKRGEGFIASGDLASARLVLRRAAEAGEAQAALSLAGTYDPIALEKLGLQGPTADIEKARTWYKRAQELGSVAAPERLQLLAGHD